MTLNSLLLVPLALLIGAASCGVPDRGGLAAAADGEVQLIPVWGKTRSGERHRDGFSWRSFTVEGRGDGSLIADERPYEPPLDFSGRFAALWIRVDRLEVLSSLELRLSSDGVWKNFYAFSLPLYADSTFNFLQSGVWTRITLSFGGAREMGKPRRSSIRTVGLVLGGRRGERVTAEWGGLAMVSEPSEGVLSLTFDDGYDEHFAVAAPRMAEHGFRGTAYVMPEQIGEFPYMALDQLRQLQDEFGWDVAAHHALPLTQLAPDRLETTLLGIRQYLIGHGFAAGSRHLAYPLGRQNASLVRPAARKHFATARIASGGPETIPPADPHLLRALNVLRTTTPDEIADAARRARLHKEWLILMFHYLVEDPRAETEYSLKNFDLVLEKIDREGIPVKPVSEVWASFR